MARNQYKVTLAGGKLTFGDPVSFRSQCAKMPDGDYWLTLKRDRPSRSDQQNRYYRGVVVKLLADYTGFTPYEMHDALRMQFLTRQDLANGRDGSVPLVLMQSTTDLDTAEMENYLSRVREWASAELGVYIPLPNEATQPEWCR